MFGTSKKIALSPNLESSITKYEESQIGLQVISAEIFRSEQLIYEVGIEIIKITRINLIEEFVLRAGIEFSPAIELSDLCNILGLDFIFLKETIDRLTETNMIENDALPKIVSSPEGKEAFKNRILKENLGEREITLAYCPITGEWNHINESDIERGSSIDSSIDISHFNKSHEGNAPTLDDIKKVCENENFDWYEPEEGIEIDSITYTEELDPLTIDWIVFLVRDIVNDSLFLRVKSPLGNNEMKERLVQNWLDNGDIVLKQLIFESEKTIADLDDPIHLEYLEKAKKQIASARKQHSKPSYQLLTDRNIRHKFLTMIDSAKEKVVIVSPWVTAEAVDKALIDKFREKSNRGIPVIIVWGLAKFLDRETRVPEDELLKDFQSIMLPNGWPGLCCIWCGNQHRKLISVDAEMIMTGSHNFLSYRGDRLPRGEDAVFLPDSDLSIQQEKMVAGLIKDSTMNLIKQLDDKEVIKRIVALYFLNAYELPGVLFNLEDYRSVNKYFLEKLCNSQTSLNNGVHQRALLAMIDGLLKEISIGLQEAFFQAAHDLADILFRAVYERNNKLANRLFQKNHRTFQNAGLAGKSKNIKNFLRLH